MEQFSFQEYDKKLKKEVKQDIKQEKSQEEKKEDKKKINFQQMPENTNKILSTIQTPEKEKAEFIKMYMKEEQIPIPNQSIAGTSYLSLVLTPDLRDLELMIRGLETVKRYNPLSQKEEIILRKIADHPLNEYGVNRILSELRIYSSPEIKLGRKTTKNYYNSVQHVCRSIVRLIYKNLRNFGMDSQVKQRNAKSLCNAIIEFVDASFSRSIEGMENQLSRATELKIEGTVDPEQYTRGFTKDKKEALKN